MLSKIGVQEIYPEFSISITQIKKVGMCVPPLLNMPQDNRQDHNDRHAYRQKVYIYINVNKHISTSLSDRFYKYDLNHSCLVMYLSTDLLLLTIKSVSIMISHSDWMEKRISDM